MPGPESDKGTFLVPIDLIVPANHADEAEAIAGTLRPAARAHDGALNIGAPKELRRPAVEPERLREAGR